MNLEPLPSYSMADPGREYADDDAEAMPRERAVRVLKPSILLLLHSSYALEPSDGHECTRGLA